MFDGGYTAGVWGRSQVALSSQSAHRLSIGAPPPRAFLGTFACELAEMGGEAFSVRKAFNARGRVERAVVWAEPWGTHGRRANGRPTSWAFEVATQLCAHVLQDIAFPFN